MPSSTDIPTRTYEVEYDEGSGTARVRIEIPETWKVTFGPIMGAGAKTAGYMGALAFRVWESDTKQRFLLSNVKSFRDLSIPVTMAAVRAFGQETWHANTGQFEGPNAELVQKDWKPLDEVSENPLTVAAAKNPRNPDDDDEVPVNGTSWRTPVTARRKP